jgi:hypothetical protein
MNRREFSKIAAAGSAGIGISPVILPDSGWKGSNDRVNVACNRYLVHRVRVTYRSMQKIPGVKVSALLRC